MKGFLTFTLAAGVAISATSIAQAEGVVKGAASANRTSSIAQSPMGVAGLGLTLDRVALNRELSRLNELLLAGDADSVTSNSTPSVQEKSVPIWTY